MKSTLLKFGLVTHLFEDISKFRQSLKALQDSVPRPKSKMRKKKAGAVSVSRADKEVRRVSSQHLLENLHSKL